MFTSAHLRLKKVSSQVARAGFTLVELMVVVAIFGVLTTVVLYKNSDFNNSFLLTDVAYDVALTIRQAQVYGLNVKNSGKIDAGRGLDGFNNGYGVYFERDSSTGGATGNSAIFFADAFTASVPLGSKTYDSGEELSTLVLSRGYKISRFCTILSGDSTPWCSGNTSGHQLNKLAIVFARPNPDATISDNSGTFYSEARITVTSPDGTKSKTIRVTTAGQISIE